MATASLTIDRTGMSGSPADLVFSGSNGTAWGLIDLSEPIMLPVTEYASRARFLDGGVATASTYDLTAIAAVVELKQSTAAALASAYAELVAALRRIRYEVTITKNSQSLTYQAQGRGGLAPAKNLDHLDLSRTTQLYNLTIPVHPVPIS